MNNNILILGGGGFIGRALIKRLSGISPEIHVVSPHPVHYDEVNVHFHLGNLDNKIVLDNTLPDCDIIIHLASTTTPGDSLDDPTIEIEQNVLPTVRLLDYLSKYKNKYLIYFSSGGAIYRSSGEAIQELAPTNPLSYYGAGKLSIEHFLNTYSQLHQHKTTILRPSNIYGPGHSPRKGFGLIHTVLRNIEAKKLISIWGDGKIIRDYVYIDDITDLIVSLLEQRPPSGTFNVGSNMGYSINDIISICQAVSKINAEVQYIPQRPIDIKSVILDSSNIFSTTGWKAKTSLESGIRATWKWIQANK